MTLYNTSPSALFASLPAQSGFHSPTPSTSSPTSAYARRKAGSTTMSPGHVHGQTSDDGGRNRRESRNDLFSMDWKWRGQATGTELREELKKDRGVGGREGGGRDGLGLGAGVGWIGSRRQYGRYVGREPGRRSFIAVVCVTVDCGQDDIRLTTTDHAARLSSPHLHTHPLHTYGPRFRYAQARSSQARTSGSNIESSYRPTIVTGRLGSQRPAPYSAQGGLDESEDEIGFGKVLERPSGEVHGRPLGVRSGWQRCVRIEYEIRRGAYDSAPEGARAGDGVHRMEDLCDQGFSTGTKRDGRWPPRRAR